MVVKMELNETNICVDRVSVAISSEMFDNYVFWRESLGNNFNNGKYILTNTEIGVFFIMYYDKRSRSVRLFRGTGSDPYSPLANIRDYGSIKTLAANHHVLEFNFKENEFIVARADGYYYQDYSGFFRMMNDIIGEVFKIQK